MPTLSWAEAHGALTHMPVAFLLAVAFFEIGAALFRKPEWRVVSFWLLVAAVAMAVPSLITGWITGNDLVFTGSAAGPPKVFTAHRLFAFTTSAIAIVLLLWRVKAKDRLAGRALGASILLSAIMAACVGYTGFLGGRMVFGGGASQHEKAAAKAVSQPASLPAVDAASVKKGQQLFVSLPCASCHRMDGKGGISGPDLTHEATRHSDIAWHIAHLKDPGKMSPNSDMPPFNTLPPSDLHALAAYLATRQ